MNANFLFRCSPSKWTDEEIEDFMQDDFDTLVDSEMFPYSETINGVLHTEYNEFNAIDKTQIEFSGHPLGTVYLDGGWGYVQSGYRWLRFDIDLLDIFSDKEE